VPVTILIAIFDWWIIIADQPVGHFGYPGCLDHLLQHWCLLVLQILADQSDEKIPLIGKGTCEQYSIPPVRGYGSHTTKAEGEDIQPK
jgi:hypothetical protein